MCWWRCQCGTLQQCWQKHASEHSSPAVNEYINTLKLYQTFHWTTCTCIGVILLKDEALLQLSMNGGERQWTDRAHPRRRGIRRGLGPGGTRGTIELLCRGGGQISGWRFPLRWWDTHKKTKLNVSLVPEPVSCRCPCEVSGDAVGVKRPAARAPEVRREGREQYARVLSGAQCARIYPGWFIQATGPAAAPTSLLCHRTLPCLPPPHVHSRTRSR